MFRDGEGVWRRLGTKGRTGAVRGSWRDGTEGSVKTMLSVWDLIFPGIFKDQVRERRNIHSFDSGSLSFRERSSVSLNHGSRKSWSLSIEGLDTKKID